MGDNTKDTVPGPVLEAFGFEGGHALPFESGQVNQHWLVEAGARKAVVRRYHVSRLAPAAGWGRELVGFAEQRGWPVAGACSTTSGEPFFGFDGRLWSASSFLEGEHPPEDSLPMQHVYGRLLARLHHDLAGFPVEGQRPGCGKLWELDAWVAPANAGSFNDLLGAFEREHPELATSVRRYRYRNLRELSRLHFPDLPDLPVHGDWSASNLLWHEGQLSGVLDFDWCRRDALACDLAAALPWDDVTDGRVRNLIEGYQAVRVLEDTEWELLPALARAHLLFFIAFRLVEWRILRGERPTASIARTVGGRLPRTEALTAFLREVRAVGGVADRR